MHWGLYSVPSVSSEWFWEQWKGPKPDQNVVNFMKQNFRPGFTYADFGPMFTAEFFNASKFAAIVKDSGAKWVKIAYLNESKNMHNLPSFALILLTFGTT